MSADEARRVAVHAQGLATPGADAAAVLKRLGALALGTFTRLGRSHEFVVQSRVGATDASNVDAGLWGTPATGFEYEAHGTCLLAVETWPSFAFRRRAQRARTDRRFAPPILDRARDRLRRGPVVADGADARRVLDVLLDRGEAVCASRREWQRVYDLPERVLPAHVLQREPSDEKCVRNLARRAARALGVATERDLDDYFRITMTMAGAPPDARRMVTDTINEAGLVPVQVEGWEDVAYALPDAVGEGGPSCERSVVLSPLDSLVWNRDRVTRLFGVDLALDRMPVLVGDHIAGTVDLARDGAGLVVRLATVSDADAVEPFASALREAATWVGCEEVVLDRVQPRGLTTALRRALK